MARQAARTRGPYGPPYGYADGGVRLVPEAEWHETHESAVRADRVGVGREGNEL